MTFKQNGLNETHDPQLRSWIESANAPDTDFPIQNLPFGIFRRRGTTEKPRGGIAIGDQIFDVGNFHYEETAFRNHLHSSSCQAAVDCRDNQTLNKLMSRGNYETHYLRLDLSRIFRAEASSDASLIEAVTRHLVPMNAAEMFLPANIGDYTDFYASIFHATNVGRMFRPDNPLLPNYKYVPIAYHGRASSINISGTPVHRPQGQTQANETEPPAFAPSKTLDYELEVGFFVGRGNELGTPIKIDEAGAHIFGACLVNDWSARDVQKWEYQPLGPFLAKNFATTVSPWVVTTEALLPFRTAAFSRPEGDPAPLPYLLSDEDQQHGGLDLKLEVYLTTAQMRREGIAPHRLSRSNLRDMYWTSAQMLAHHTSNGCNLRAGDLYASGTVSGATEDERGCLLELTERGKRPVELPTGETRRFLQDDDEVIMRGYCEADGFNRIGFGECRGIVLPANGVT